MRVCHSGRVTELEAQRLEEVRPDREAFLNQLRSDIEQQVAPKLALSIFVAVSPQMPSQMLLHDIIQCNLPQLCVLLCMQAKARNVTVHLPPIQPEK